MKWDEVKLREGDRIKVKTCGGDDVWATVNRLHRPFTEGFSASTDGGGLLILYPLSDDSTTETQTELLEHIPVGKGSPDA